ncbi:MaoC family dehydratase [Actinosynnema sp. NPDC047251]|uniref:Acyl dehydratase n=1 Tax=Saccharothrix espanaensis (strain ATCC 51144 / DSM 44229 / JCM 9112 / NBRC 15066 / NRRL 15764) TaxID=1179773 RepID=K0JPX1_SACES|nr:MaoC family dehydratase [Saccharothrix espanaensis]CCH29255.1 Acyl dehydratase [Saccharothrix espanaensis DSM 44229]
MRTFPTLDALGEATGEHLGHGSWHEITQREINLFAEATDDHQWIHVDLEKAKAGPFGAPVAHGYLTLSLIPSLVRDIYTVQNLSMGVNYGLNKVRFPTPVTVGSRVRAGAELTKLTDFPPGKQAIIKVTVEIEGHPKPACVAETVVLYIP